MYARRYEISLRVLNLTSHSFAALTRDLSRLTREGKLHIYSCQVFFSI